MRTLDRYIGYEVARSTFVVLVALLAILSFITFTDELARVGKGGYDVPKAIQFVILTLPTLLYQLFPPAALLGTLIGLGAMASHSEITAMRAAGVSVRQMLHSIAKVGVLLMLVTFVVGEYIAPETETYAQTMRATAINQGTTFKTSGALWLREGNSYVKLHDVEPGGRVGSVFVYQFDAQHVLQSVIEAEQAFYQGRNQWLMTGVTRQIVQPDRIEIEQLAQQRVTSLLSPELLNAVLVRPETMSAWVLYRYAEYLQDNGVDAREYVQAFWSKVVSPISTAIMVMLGVPFIFGPLRSATAGYRVLVGIIAGVGFHIFQQVFHYIGLVFELPPLLAAVLPSTLFLIIAVLLLRRVR